MNNETIDLLQYLPTDITTQEEKRYPLHMQHDEVSIGLSYQASLHNQTGECGTQEFSCTIPRYITKNERTFEVLGLLQAEMGKTQNGTLSFSNCEPRIIKIVMDWFEKEELLDSTKWRWSIKVNINEPRNQAYSAGIEEKCVSYWLNKTKIAGEGAYPKKVTYIKNTANKILKEKDRGTLVLEYRNNLFSQVIKSFVKKITYEQITNEEPELIRGYMRGIIAGEGCINHHRKSRHYAVHISATKPEEQLIYKRCLSQLGINLKVYQDYSEMLISEKYNLLQLYYQRLMTLHEPKYNKFLVMIHEHMPELSHIKENRSSWNKHPQEKIDKILELYKKGVTSTKEIAEQTGVSLIKVNRVLRKNNLGKRKIPNCTEELKKKVVVFIEENPMHTNRCVAGIFNISEAAVQRIRVKYKLKKPRKLLKATQGQIEEIRQLYKQDPAIKFKEVIEKVGVSDTTLKNIRKKYELTHLGYKRKVGCNNKKELLDKNNIKN